MKHQLRNANKKNPFAVTLFSAPLISGGASAMDWESCGRQSIGQMLVERFAG